MSMIAVTVSTQVYLNSNTPFILVCVKQLLEDCYVLRLVQLVAAQTNAVLVAAISRRIPRRWACVAAVGRLSLQ